MSDTVVFILSDMMKSSKSGYSIVGQDGTEISMDFPDEYPLVMQTEVLEDGEPVELRLLPQCKTILKKEQLKLGFPETFRWRDEDRKKLTFKAARLELDRKRDAHWVEYMMRSAWMLGNEDKKMRETTKTIYQVWDEDKILTDELDMEELIVHAKGKILAMRDEEVKDLYRLAMGNMPIGSDVSPKHMKRTLIAMAEDNPNFVLDGVSTSNDELTLLVNKAIEFKIISLAYIGEVAYFHPVKEEWQVMLQVSDDSSAEEKHDRLIEYLQTEKGQTELNIIRMRVDEVEAGKLIVPEMTKKAADKKAQGKK